MAATTVRSQRPDCNIMQGTGMANSPATLQEAPAAVTDGELSSVAGYRGFSKRHQGLRNISTRVALRGSVGYA
jgi:hypothetical protein